MIYISLKGNFDRVGAQWEARISGLGIKVCEERPLKCLKGILSHFQGELPDPQMEYFIKVGDEGVFYLLASKRPSLIAFLVDSLSREDSDLSNEAIDRWFKIETKF